MRCRREISWADSVAGGQPTWTRVVFGCLQATGAARYRIAPWTPLAAPTTSPLPPIRSERRTHRHSKYCAVQGSDLPSQCRDTVRRAGTWGSCFREVEILPSRVMSPLVLHAACARAPAARLSTHHELLFLIMSERRPDASRSSRTWRMTARTPASPAQGWNFIRRGRIGQAAGNDHRRSNPAGPRVARVGTFEACPAR